MASVITTPASLSPFAAVAQTPAGHSLSRRLEQGGLCPCDGLSLPAQPFLAAWVRELFPSRPIVVVTPSLKLQEGFLQDIQTWLALRPRAGEPAGTGAAPAGAGGAAPSPADRALFYPAWETLPHESKLPHADVISERLETLVALSAWRAATLKPGPGGAAVAAPVVVSSVNGLLQLTFPPGRLVERTRTLRRGDRVVPLDLIEWLEDQGYEPEVQVNHKGEIALRGGIIDLFPLTLPWPVRLEFFGDELESLRFFDPISQLSRERVGEVTIPPGGELGILKRMLARAATDAAATEGHAGEAPPTPALPPAPVLATLLDYLPRETVFILSQPEALEQAALDYAAQVPPGDPFFTNWDALRAQLLGAGMTLLALSDTEPPAVLRPVEQERADEGEATGQGQPILNRPAPLAPHGLFRMQSLDAYRPVGERAPDPQIAEVQRREFFAQMHRWSRQHHQVHVFCNNDGERQRFLEVWKDYGFEPDPGMTLELGSLSGGFLSPEARLVVVTDAEIFGRYKVQRPRRIKSPHAQGSRSLLDIDFTDLEEGDYVVHLQHGIGRYLGLNTVAGKGGNKPLEKASASLTTEQECLVIEYAAPDPAQPAPRLYVPLSEAHLVSKYVGAGKARPVLNTLGGGRWTKTKEQAERAVRDLAADLLSIQAARASQEGHACKADTPWQREFESSFLYEETPDQWKAIVATKADMESARPMDRLICGDVGYGKTEVAIRAAFKAVMDGRQVAMLVPTTVLAQQHFNTLRERMADYPIQVELLSRFRTARETRKVIQDLATGAVDIVIGTHRLVQSDIAFKDLGLVVIDEEQRFGVAHKEKFKILRRLVDVLTLSATPIPRTLYLALTGARDMSTIETPPLDRLPVETIVTEFDERVIRDAILRELNRGGQVFYLHNRVGDIETVALKLRALVPKARMVVGHGQMDAEDLEEVMTRFIAGEADVLLSTTIIESGIDIPNANTIIIDRADRFGLSDLYQLRGRVGRYKHQAYAYLLVPRHARLLTDARKRISAIKQYSSLGSGFKIAMRDLEIRGAGNLLGAQQSGHITAVGFDLYCQLLKQSVARLKGEPVKPRIDLVVRLDFLLLDSAEDAAPQPAAGAGARSGTRSAQGKAKGKGKGKARGKGTDQEEEAEDMEFTVSVPREVASYTTWDSDPEPEEEELPLIQTPAGLPLRYVPDPKQRIEIYRKLAEVTEEEGINRLKAELRDRFGPLPSPVELLLQVAELKLLAASRGVTTLETRTGKLMLTRHKDLMMVGGRFPRLTRKDPRARLNEIKRLLLALQ